ncbi:PAQR family membrane homeostasis protein TrhA [Alkalicoccobacillus gibsonii]|uniref:PAQR family membrane homeostasis protein TrhA n=1 Tax=Alkalicoccobacillus gibsonii TaxID=79881 RepID=UPI001931D005|nr:hemolysin III family protein [Alkalicoccobacillus gibsonii]MBM0067330.1 hemolysin III family protein [Alkalicoccobacillus gibsonii]
MATTHVFSKDEELANAITHGIGAVISIACLTLLIVFASLYGNAWHIVSFSIYGTSMLLLYASSTLVHSFPPGKAKDLFEILDHSAIYLFIAGTYTPILFIVVQGALGWTLFGIIWGIATLGIVFKIFFVKKFLVISTIFYLLMGWMALFAIKPIVLTLPIQGTLFLIGGGVLYSLGTIFYIWRGFKFHHAVWHLFVLGGTVLHFFLVIMYILPIH